MNHMRTLDDLAEHTGMSKSYWYRRSAKRGLICTRFGNEIRFTDEQWAETLALYASTPKQTPTRDELAARRQAVGNRSRKAA